MAHTQSRRTTRVVWSTSVVLALLSLLGAASAGWLLAAPPADPVVTIINTGSGGLAVLTDRQGGTIVLGGSQRRTAAASALDTHLLPWHRPIGLLLVPPPYDDRLPGALELLARRSVGYAALLGSPAHGTATLATWQQARTMPPIVGQVPIALAGDGELLIDVDPDPSVPPRAVVWRGEVRLLLLLAAESGGSLQLPTAASHPPAGVVMLGRGPLSPTLSPPLVIRLDGGGTLGPPRTIIVGESEVVRVTLLPDRLRVSGDAVSAMPRP